MPVKTVSIEKICIILAGEGHPPMTKMAVSHFVKEGMPKAERGMYDPQACTHWYLGRLRTSVKRKESESEDGERLSLDKQQIRLIGAKADNEEMTASERRSNLLPLSVYETEMAKLVGIVRMQLLNLPSRIAPKVEGLTRSECKALLSASVNGILSALAKGSRGNSDPNPVDAPAKRPRARAAKKSRSRKR